MGPAIRLPFSLDDASRADSEVEAADSQYNKVLLETRLNNRVLDLRVSNSLMEKLSFDIAYRHKRIKLSLSSRLLLGTFSATSSARKGSRKYTALSFKVRRRSRVPPCSKLATSKVINPSNFDNPLSSMCTGNAFLAQSPQLAKQMAIAADFERVYEIGPVFRAEDSNTHRHMTEFMGLDLEMTIEEHYHEVMELLDSLFLSIFKGLRETYKKEIDTVRKQFPADEFKWREGPEGTLKFTFRQAVDLLVEDGVPREDLDDIRHESLLYPELPTAY